MDTIFQADLTIVTWIHEHLSCAFLDWLLPFITTLGNSGFIWLVFSVLLLWNKKTRPYGVMCALALLMTTLIGEFAIKNLVGRLRPFSHLPQLTLLISPPSGFSFPSGHSSSSFAGALCIYFMDKKLGRCALVLAGLIAFSRLYLTVHYLTDVACGIALGIACAYLSRWICRKFSWGKNL